MVLGLTLSACKTATPTAVSQATKPAPVESEATAAPDAEKLKVVIATDAAFPPMEFVDANKDIVGFDIDMMNAVA
ncbi:MAG: transporter substrate-binding domain-containing protein, partial [Chloroflexi bacterium]|nr:transporter substrate-binding domain-containing protein [Chloroflexota bacterium]